MLEAARIEWEFTAPFTVTTDEGEIINLTQWAPKFVEAELQRAWDRKERRLLGGAVGLGGRATVEPVKAFLASAKGMSALGRDSVERLVEGGVWTNDRLAQAGYLVVPFCPRCGQPDGVHHRLWMCPDPEVSEVRAAVASRELIAQAVAAGPHDPRFTRAIAQDPMEDLNCGAAGPAREEHVVLQTRAPGGRWEPFNGSPKGFFQDGPLYTDGSMVREAWADLSRAGWGIYQPDPGGGVERRAFGPNWTPMLQTAPAAEWAAWLMATGLMQPAARGPVRSDCLHVVRWLAKPAKAALHGGFIHAGFVRQGLASEAGLKAPVSKVAGHAREKGLQVSEAEALGNEQADEAARLGRECHPQPEQQDVGTSPGVER